MRTPDDRRGDGRHTSYLRQPGLYRHLDPELFDALNTIVHTKRKRMVELVERAKLIRNAQYFSELITRVPKERAAYFQKMARRFKDVDIVFFDPDNGLSVASVPYGATGAEKYVYANEWKRVAEEGKSVLIYQHFPRVKRDVYARMRMEHVGRESNAAEVVSIASSRVLYLAISARNHQRMIRTACEEMAAEWKMRSFTDRPQGVRS
jgi:hypothetical protein